MKHKKVWGEGTPWKTESAWLSYIRGGIRRGLWNRNPVKVNFLKSNTVKIKNTNSRSATRFPYVNGLECNICKKLYRASEVEVDHIEGNHSLRSIGDIGSFIKGIVLVTEDDLQALCKPCHKTKSLADARGISFNEAEKEQKIIEFRKLKANKQVDKLNKIGYTPETSSTKRVEQFRGFIFRED